MLGEVLGDAAYPPDPSLLISDRKERVTDPAHAAIRPDDVVLVRALLPALDALEGGAHPVTVVGVKGLGPVTRIAQGDLHRLAPDRLVSRADVLHLAGFEILDPQHRGGVLGKLPETLLTVPERRLGAGAQDRGPGALGHFLDQRYLVIAPMARLGLMNIKRCDQPTVL